MNPDLWKIIASVGGVLVTAVTGPIIWAMHAEARAIRAETKQLLAELEKRLNERIDTRLVHR